ncbi:MAG: hypothetical protein FWF40_01975, partial [Methanomassiliicoccaceae archaeon]|nr:hypothetical protein [Methanomassiliicoccaceae archaeon]
LTIGTGANAVGPISVTSGSTWFSDGTSVTIEPNATGTSNHFSTWSGTTVPAGFQKGSGAAQTFTMNGSYDMTANFTDGVNDHQLTLAVSGDGVIVVTVGTEEFSVPTLDTWFSDGQSITLEPKANNTNTNFSYWSGTVPTGFNVGSGLAQTFTVDDTYDMTAFFVTNGYKLTLNVDDITGGDGKITVTLPDGNTFDVTDAYTGYYDRTTPVKISLEAVSGTASQFSNWVAAGTPPSGISGDADISFYVDANYALTAVFFGTGTGFTLNLSVEGDGFIALTVGGITTQYTTYTHDYKDGTSISLKAVPNGTTFSHWFDGTDVVQTLTLPVTMNAPHTIKAYFFAGDGSDNSYKITVNVAGSGTVDVTFSDPDHNVVTRYNVNGTTVVYGTNVTFTSYDGTDPFSYWDDGTVRTDNPYNATNVGVGYAITAYFLQPTEEKSYFIFAAADRNSTITPAGSVGVSPGDSMTFMFNASDGYVLSVYVDKVLVQSQITSGSYTFTNVVYNRTISVVSTPESLKAISLTIDVMRGSGYEEYSVNGSPFTTYVSPVALSLNDNVVVKAYPNGGYYFEKWETPGTVTTTQATFNNVTSSLALKAYFSESGSAQTESNNTLLWVLIAVILIIIVCLLIWYLLFHRSTVDVIKIGHSVSIIGKDRVRKKGEYRFTIQGGGFDPVSYRIGENGEWKTLAPGPNGEFVIQKGEITDTLTIEHR